MSTNSQPAEKSSTILSGAAPPAKAASSRAVWRRTGRAVAFALLLAPVYEAWVFAQVWRLRAHNPETTAFMQQGLARLQAKIPSASCASSGCLTKKSPPHLKRAVLAAEDQSFLAHRGFDWDAIRDAYERNQREQRSTHGGSSITQQLAKNLFLSPRRTYFRKAQEAVIAVMIEAALPKRRTLEMDLNVIEWGDGIYGVEAAAQHYFGVSAAQLDAQRSARLATVISAPRRYNPLRDTEFMQRRIAFVLAFSPFVPVP
jgi:monofunctional biosynthetic peptidoglycan transglycosylase